jgi:cobalamin biosynthesis protein CobT
MAISRIDVLRDAVVKITQIISGQGIKVTQSGVNAFVQSDSSGKPVRVNLPYIPDNADEALINAIQGFLDHEVAHILFSDFGVLNRGHKEGVMNYLNTLEDPRIEICMTKKFDGSAWNLQKVGEFFLERYTTPAFNESMSKMDFKKSVMILMVPAIRAWAGQKLFQNYMNDKWYLFEEVIDRCGADLIRRIGEMQSTQDAYDIAVEMKAALETPPKDKMGGDGDTPEDRGTGGKSTHKKKASDDTEADTTGSSSGDKMEADSDDEPIDDEGSSDETHDRDPSDDKEPSDHSEGEKSEKGESSESSEGSDKSDDKKDDDDSHETYTAGDSETKEGEASSNPDASDDRGKGATFSPDEFEKAMKEADFEAAVSGAIADSTIEALKDSEYIVYSKDEDVIEPLKITRWYEEYLTDLQNKVDHIVAPLQKDLERAITARSYSSWTSGHRSGRLHAANLARLAVNDSRVFRRKHESQSKDVAVSLVIDCSGSMSGGGRIYTAAQAAYAMSSVLDRLQISHEVIGFTTDGVYGDSRGSFKDVKTKITEQEVQDAQIKLGRNFSRRDRIYMPVVKSFNDRMTIDIKKRFAYLPHIRLSQNVDGECLEIAARRLMQRRETGKIIMVLSDGAPCCSGSGHQQRGNLTKVVSQIESSGTKIVGIGIQSDSVKDYYKRNVVLENINDLPSTVVRQLKDLLLN